MKILIVSDTHRKTENLFKVLEKEKKIDFLIHLGDIEGDERLIETSCGCSVCMVAGNNDFITSLPTERIFQIGKYCVMITHGHRYYISMGNEMIKQEAVARGADIVMYGHTHRPVIDKGKGIVALNPGSLSYPRQENRRPSYIIMELDSQGEAHFEIKYL